MSLSSSSSSLRVRLVSPNATVPTRGSQGAAGYDLYSIEDGVVPLRGRAVVSTGISITVPNGTYGRIAPRSGLAAKHSIAVGAGVVDADFTGIVQVIMFNHSDEDFHFSKGDRIAQLVLERIMTPDVVVVDELDETERSDKGLGSTGV